MNNTTTGLTEWEFKTFYNKEYIAEVTAHKLGLYSQGELQADIRSLVHNISSTIPGFKPFTIKLKSDGHK